MNEEHHHHHALKVNGDKNRASLAAAMAAAGSGNNHQHHHHDSLHHHQDSTAGHLPAMLHHQQQHHQHDDALDSLTATESDSVIPTTVAQHGMTGMCDERYVDKYPKYDKYGDPGMEFNALSQRYLSGDMNIGSQGQLLGPAIGLHGFKDATAYATLASHPFSIQRLLPGATDAKSDVKMFDMSAYGGYPTLGPAGHGTSLFSSKFHCYIATL